MSGPAIDADAGQVARPSDQRAPPVRLAAVVRAGAAFATTAVWAALATLLVRRRLRSRGLADLHGPGPPRARRGSRRGLAAGLRATRASCLEGCLVRRRWHAAAGDDVRVVIGVSDTVQDFGAHAWLESDRPPGERFTELLIWPEGEGEARTAPTV